ncbi:MAG TPA: hypothetical protein VLQ80_27155, partial [Candidatus Saccharimonadia bacterium]|nr:hypothetical protein [Candidatus Saccharimonadia bacterium]
DEATYLAWLQDSGFVVQWRQFIPEGNDGHVLLLAQRLGDTAAPQMLELEIPQSLLRQADQVIE